jgi:hypothetical protein
VMTGSQLPTALAVLETFSEGSECAAFGA